MEGRKRGEKKENLKRENRKKLLDGKNRKVGKEERKLKHVKVLW